MAIPSDWPVYVLIKYFLVSCGQIVLFVLHLSIIDHKHLLGESLVMQYTP